MRLTVARIGRAHGVRGEVTVEVRTDRPDERFVPGVTLWVAEGTAGPGVPRSLELRTARPHRELLLLSFEGVQGRDAAEALRGAVLEAEVPEASDEPDAWYDHELVGLEVRDPDGAVRGTVSGVRHGAQDLLVVRTPDHGERLVPLVTALVPVVDTAAGHLVVADPGGLLADLDGDAG